MNADWLLLNPYVPLVLALFNIVFYAWCLALGTGYLVFQGPYYALRGINRNKVIGTSLRGKKKTHHIFYFY